MPTPFSPSFDTATEAFARIDDGRALANEFADITPSEMTTTTSSTVDPIVTEPEAHDVLLELEYAFLEYDVPALV